MPVSKPFIKTVIVSLSLLSTTAFAETEKTPVASKTSQPILVGSYYDIVPTKLPPTSFAVSLLKQQLQSQTASHEIPPQLPILVLGGHITSEIALPNLSESSLGLNLEDTNLEAAVLVNPWVLGNVSIAYNNEKGGKDKNLHVGNSALSINRAAIIIGNLLRSPWYAALGQYPVAFSSKPLWLTKARAVTIGAKKTFKQDQAGVHMAVFGFNSDVTTSDTALKQKKTGLNFGACVDYTLEYENLNIGFGSAYLYNIIDAKKIRSIIFAEHSIDEHSASPVSAVSLQGNIKRGPLKLSGEWVFACEAFLPRVFAFEGKGAIPSIMYAELAYEFTHIEKYTPTVTVGYEQSFKAHPIVDYQHNISVGVKTTLLENFTAALTFRCKIPYAQTVKATLFGEDAKAPAKSLTNSLEFQLKLNF
jgi:hypothetical protein